MIDNRTAPYAALLLRVVLGGLFLAHAWLKIFVFTPAGTVGFFQSLGLPGALAYVVMAVEVVGGLALIFGVYARVAAIVLIPGLLGAIVTVHAAAKSTRLPEVQYPWLCYDEWLTLPVKVRDLPPTAQLVRGV